MVYQTNSVQEGLKIASKLLRDPRTPKLWRRRRDELLQQQIDLTEWMIKNIEAFDPARDALGLANKEIKRDAV